MKSILKLALTNVPVKRYISLYTQKDDLALDAYVESKFGKSEDEFV